MKSQLGLSVQASKPTQPVFMRLAGKKCPVGRMGAGCQWFWAKGVTPRAKTGWFGVRGRRCFRGRGRG